MADSAIVYMIQAAMTATTAAIGGNPDMVTTGSWATDHKRVLTKGMRLLGDNGPCYLSSELAGWLDGRDMAHTRGAPYHPQIQAFVEHYNHQRYHESLGNLTPADVYFGRGDTIILEHEKIKRQTIQNRRL